MDSLDTWDPLRKREILLLVRVSLAQQNAAQAIEMLERWSQYLDQSGDSETALQFLALQVAALQQAGKREQAAAVAARLLTLTEPEGYIRVYLDAGTPMKQVLKALLAALQDGKPGAPALAISRPYVLRVLLAFEQEEGRSTQGRDAPTQKTLSHTPQHAVQEGPIEPLSRQEQRVLRLLVAGRTYAEMAQELIVSPNTVKTQISSIYRKLGVSRRAEAIAMASRLHLL